MTRNQNRIWMCDGIDYTIYWTEGEGHRCARLNFQAGPQSVDSVMYRGPGSLSDMSEEMLQFCLRVACSNGFVWVDPKDGVAWHVEARSRMTTIDGEKLEVRFAEPNVKLWHLDDWRLQKLAAEAREEEMRSSKLAESLAYQAKKRKRWRALRNS